MSDYAELVKRLQKHVIWTVGYFSGRRYQDVEPICAEAADAIEALIREREELRLELISAYGQAQENHARGYRDGLEKAAEECDRLWKAAARAIRALIPE